MKQILTRPKYDGYTIKCRKCKCEFFASFADVQTLCSDEFEYVLCPTCTYRIYRSLFWKKHELTEV